MVAGVCEETGEIIMSPAVIWQPLLRFSGCYDRPVAKSILNSLRYPPGINDINVAFLAASNLEYGLSRMFGISSRAETPIRVFRKMDQAEKWMME
jgi:hypothetical protein